MWAHQRNLQDRQIQAIAEKGGLIGVVFLGRFVESENPELDHVLDHADHIAKLAGVEHINMGPDYVDYCHDMLINSGRVAEPEMPLNEQVIPFAKGLEDASELVSFTEGLLSRGYEEWQMQGILDSNFLRFFKFIREENSHECQ